MPRARFFLALGLVCAVAFGVRTAFVLGVAQHDDEFYDAFYYELQAYTLADGNGFTDPLAYFPGSDGVGRPSADHPPLTGVVLGAVAWLFGDDVELELRFTTALAGVATVFLLGVLGRDLAGDLAGLIAAGLGAVYPFLWLNDGLLMSESFAALATTGAVVLGVRLRNRPRVAAGVALGVVCGLAALTRAELLLLVPGFALVHLLAPPRASWLHRLGVAATPAVAALVVIAPWVLYNRSRFDESVTLSTNDGLTLLGANCDATYHGPNLGMWLITPGVCIPETAPPGDQSVVSRRYRAEAFEYMREHASRLPVVIAARLGRTWNLFRPGDMVRLNEGEGRPRWATAAGLVMYYPLALAAAGGGVALRRRGGAVGPVLVPVVVVSVTSLAFYGQTRLRLPAEPTLVVLGAVAMAGAWERRRRRASPDQAGSVGGDGGSPTLEQDAPASGAVGASTNA